MRVVVVGAWQRSEAQDVQLVNKLLDTLGVKYPQLEVITRGIEKGVGKIVQNRCRPKNPGDKVGEFKYAELQLKLWLGNAPRAALAAYWDASNAFLVAIGEEFHLFCDQTSTGVMYALVNRVKIAGKPYSLYYSGVDTEPKMVDI